MHTVRSHGHARSAVEPRLVRITMKHEAIDARAERPVTLVLHGGREILPGLGSIGGKCFGGHNRSTVRMGDRCSFDAAERGLETVALRPELAHRHVRHAAERQVSHGIHVVGFNRQTKTVAPSQLLEMLGMLLDDKFLCGPAQIPQKTLGHFPTVDDAPRHDRQIPDRTVPAPLLKLGGEIRAPVL